jgi:transcriptional regulator with XRE-family HTH domain
LRPVEMSRDIKSPRHEAVRRFLKEQRQRAELTQAELAAKTDRPRAYVSAVETGQQRVTVIEFCEFADALGFGVRSAIRRIHEAKAK